MSNAEFVKNRTFYADPFKDRIVMAFNPQELAIVRAHLQATTAHKNGYEQFDRLDDNYGLVKLHTPGAANTHVIYMPVIERQHLGMLWRYMQVIITRMATEIALSAVNVAGYKPLSESAMFVHLQARLMEKIIIAIENQFGGDLAIIAEQARSLQLEVPDNKWQYINQLSPHTLADVARTQLMVENNHSVELTDNGWNATSYFY